MKIIEADVVWTPAHPDSPGAGNIRIEQHGSNWQRTMGDRWMPATCLGAYGEVPTKGSPVKQLLGMFTLFNTIVVRDGITPQAAHRAFLAIDEYRAGISPDMEGADD